MEQLFNGQQTERGKGMLLWPQRFGRDEIVHEFTSRPFRSERLTNSPFRSVPALEIEWQSNSCYKPFFLFHFISLTSILLVPVYITFWTTCIGVCSNQGMPFAWTSRPTCHFVTELVIRKCDYRTYYTMIHCRRWASGHFCHFCCTNKRKKGCRTSGSSFKEQEVETEPSSRQ